MSGPLRRIKSGIDGTEALGFRYLTRESWLRTLCFSNPQNVYR